MKEELLGSACMRRRYCHHQYNAMERADDNDILVLLRVNLIKIPD